MSSYRPLIFAAMLWPLGSVIAQAVPADQTDDAAVTIGVIRSPDTTAPDEIVRKIPPRQSRTRAKTSDDSDSELASPRGESGGNTEPGTPGDPSPTVPIDPGNPDS